MPVIVDAKQRAGRETPLMAVLAHDLRQPIQAMLLNTYLLRASQDGAVQQRACILESQLIVLQRMLDMSSELALLEHGSKTPDVRSVSWSSVFEGVRREIGDSIGLELRNSDVTINADPRLLQIMVEALALNAQKSDVQTNVALSCEAADKSWRAICAYEGAAYSETLRKAHFIEIVRRESGESVTASVGLGLAFVERLCRVLGWRLELKQPAPRRQRVELICDHSTDLPE